MSCNNVQILNYNHSVVSLSSGNTLVITDNNRCNSITIPQPVTNILQINSPGPQGPPGDGANIDTGSFVTTSSFNDWTGSNLSQFAGTASYATSASYAFSSSYAFNSTTASYVALNGLGITVNGTNLTASVRQVNGNSPDATTGNIVVPLSATKTGDSASLIASSSGAVTGSLTDGTIWIISNNTPDASKNGDTYIWSSGTTQWYYIPKLDQTAGDARWLQLSGGTMTGNITMGSGISLLGTASYAAVAPNYVLISATSSMLAPYATTGSNVFTGTQTITGSGQLIIKTTAASGVTLQTTDYSVGSGTGTNMFLGLGSSSGNTYAAISSRTNGASGPGNLSILSAGGNVAIGKTTFNAVLDVNGNTIITGSLRVTAGITGSLQGTASYATTASYALNVPTIDTSSLLTTASFNSWTGSNSSQFAGTASYASQSLSASYTETASFVTLNGLGITVNGTNLTASVRQVNGNSPDPTTGNITTALTATKTGTSASLILSSSGAVTSSLTDGTVWIISGDPTASKNGDTYIWSSGTTQWYYIPKLDQTAGDARWLQISSFNSWTGSNSSQFAGTASYASQSFSASYATTSSYATSGSYAESSSYALSSSYSTSGSYALTASYAMNAGTSINTGSFATTGSNNFIGNQIITGSLTVSGSSTFTNIGPAIFNGSVNVTQGITSSIINTQNIDVTSYGNGTIQYAADSINNNIQLDTNGIILIASSGSNVNTFNLYPTASISTVSITAPSFTGSLSGTASYAEKALSSSYVLSASYAPPQVIGNIGTSIYSITPAAGFAQGENSIIIGGQAAGDYRTVSIGYRAGATSTDLNQTISSSVFIGDQAGYSAGKASRSVFIGYRAGYGQGYNDQGYGDNCILIGNQAGATGLPGVPYYSPIGSNNIIIGNNITVPDSTSNRLNIGGVIFATGITCGSVNLTNPSFNAQNGNVGINEINPQASLDVHGSVRFSTLTTSPVALTNVLMISSSGQLFITASSAIGGGGTVNTGSLLVTASASSNIITFTKGDASTFTITVATGSSGGVSGGTNNYIPLWSGSTALTSSIASQQTGSSIIFNTPSVNVNDLLDWYGYLDVIGNTIALKNDLGVNTISSTTSTLVLDSDIEYILGTFPWIWTSISLTDNTYSVVNTNDPYYNNISSIVFYSQSFDGTYYTVNYSSSTSPGTVFPNTIYSSVINPTLPKIYVNGDLQVSGSMIGTASYSNYSNYATLAADATSVAVKFSGNTLRSTNTSNVSPTYNIFLGENAGYSGSSAYSNFIGPNAGYMSSVSTTSSYSNFLGYYAGYLAEKASYSTLIGYRVGFNASVSPYDGIGSNNIIIGTNITLPANTKDSINLGGIIFATGSYSDPTNYPYSGSVNGRVGINVVSPKYNFQVSGSVGFTDLTTSSAALTNVLMISSSGQLFVTASSAIGGGSSTTKAGSGSVASFGGSPLTSSITFTTPFINNLYAVTVIGEDARPWTIQDKVSGSFTINSNSSVALSGPVYWVATPFNNS